MTLQVEKAVLSAGANKKLVLILNKIGMCVRTYVSICMHACVSRQAGMCVVVTGVLCPSTYMLWTVLPAQTSSPGPMLRSG